MTRSHSICSFRQRVDYQVLIILPPSPHRRAWGQVDDVSNVVSDVRFLSAFVVYYFDFAADMVCDPKDFRIRHPSLLLRQSIKFLESILQISHFGQFLQNLF